MTDRPEPSDRDTYSLGAESESTDRGDGADASDAGEPGDADRPADDEAMGVPIPDEHVGAFVAEAFEDPERTTEWGDIVDAMVAPDARDAWADLSAVQQAVEVLDQAAEYDRRATDELERIPTNRAKPTPETRSSFEEAKRLRRNADAFRDGVAAAYAEGRIDDEGIVAAVEESGFDTAAIARREDALESVTAVYDFDYRPYGGTLFDEERADEGAEGEDGRDSDIPETF